MTENGFAEADECIICGHRSYVGKDHRWILLHVISAHMVDPETKYGYAKYTCWCGFKAFGSGGEASIKTHLAEHTLDSGMHFYPSVENLWAHYHASLIGVPLEKPCATSTGKG